MPQRYKMRCNVNHAIIPRQFSPTFGCIDGLARLSQFPVRPIEIDTEHSMNTIYLRKGLYSFLATALLTLSATASAEITEESKEAYRDSKHEIREAGTEVEEGYEEVRDKAQRNAEKLAEKTGEVWDKTKDKSQKVWSSTKDAFNEGVLAGKLETAIALNKHLNPRDIDIEIDGDRAYLSGTVDSDVEKELAQAIAEGIAGISKVENHLTINNGSTRHTDQAVPDRTDRDFPQYISDVSTTASIKAELLANDSIKGLDINVDTFRDQVTLTGTVERDSQRSLAETIVKKRETVTRVINNLKVSS